MKKLFALLFLIPTPLVAQQTINAAGCTIAQVTTALNTISSNGALVILPTCSVSWTSQLAFNTSFSFTLQGQSVITASDTHGNPTTWTDSTLITDGQPNTGGNSGILNIGLTGSSSQVVRMTGISWHGGGVDSEYNGDLVFAGNTGTQLRIDHNHFINEADLALSFYQPMSGVVDHNQFDVTAGNAWNGVRVYNVGGGGYGDEPWNTDTSSIWGTAAPVYLENNTFNNGYMNDCELGGSYVARYNTLNTTATGQNIGVQSHATGSQPRGRGCRSWEVYHNWLGAGAGTVQFTVGFEAAGTGVWWGNTTTNSGFILQLTSDREGNNYSQTATPNGWGYCGISKTGSASNWDGNQNSGGYPCLDNPGRGKGDLLSGYWPNVQNNTVPGNFGGVWPHEFREPIYMWMETFSGSLGNMLITSSVQSDFIANQDFYAPVSTSAQTSATSPFNGTTGTGFGTLARRPTTCTAGPSGTNNASPTGSYGVSYWATDANSGNGELYGCTATNTWTGIYQPYTYPHPLDSTLISTSTSLTSSNFTPAAGATITLTASITPSSGPTGTVTFFDGGSSIGTGAVSSGTATKSVTGITAGTHTYTANYGGDASYNTSTSSPITVTASSGSPGNIIKTGVQFTGGVKNQ